MDWSGVDYLWIIVMFVIIVSFWWHPFTAEDPLVSKWCNSKFLAWRNKHIYILHDLTKSKSSFFFFTFTLIEIIALNNFLWLANYYLHNLLKWKFLSTNPIILWSVRKHFLLVCDSDIEKLSAAICCPFSVIHMFYCYIFIKSKIFCLLTDGVSTSRS